MQHTFQTTQCEKKIQYAVYYTKRSTQLMPQPGLDRGAGFQWTLNM